MKHKINTAQQKKLWEFIRMNDFEFYETYIADLPSDAQQRFFEETPEFFAEYTGEPEKINLETDHIYQNIMRQIEKLKKEKKNSVFFS